MTTYSFGDVVLVPFPFTDLTASKRRPAVVVSSDAYNSARPDVIVMAVTSQLSSYSRLGEVVVGDWKTAGLLKASIIKPILTTIEKVLVIRTLGRLERGDLSGLRDALIRIIG
jgi:mRNA interferase MazF